MCIRDRIYGEFTPPYVVNPASSNPFFIIFAFSKYPSILALICFLPSSEYVASAALCTTYDTPLNFVQVLLFHNLFNSISSPAFVYPFTVCGITTYAHLTPVNPAVFEKLLNSIATSFAPSTS